MGGGCCVMDNAVGDFFRDLFCSDSGCGYHPSQVKTASHAKKVADELAAMKTKMDESNKKSEQKILGYVEKSMEKLLKEVEEVNNKKFGGKELNIDIDGIKAKNNVLKNEVIGFMESSINNRLVMTDPELSVILNEENDKTRGKNFDDFCKRIRGEAIEKLADKISQTIKSQENMIENEIKSRLEEVDSMMKESEAAYLNMQNAKDIGEEEVAEERAKNIYAYEVADILLETVNE